MKISKIQWIIISCLLACLITVSVVLIVRAFPPKDKYYFKIDSNKIELQLDESFDVTTLKFKTNIKDVSNYKYYVKNSTLILENNILKPTKVGNEKLYCDIKYKDKTYTDYIDIVVKFDNVDSVINVSFSATNQDNLYIMNVPNKDYLNTDVNNLAHIDVQFLDASFESDYEFYITQSLSQQDVAKNNKLGLDNQVLTRDSNNFYAVGIGKATLYVYFTKYNISKSFSVEVREISPTDILVSDNIAVDLNSGTFDISCEILPSYTTNKTLDYKVLDTNILKRYYNNTFEMFNAGTTSITISCGMITKSVVVNVTNGVNNIEYEITNAFENNGFGVISYSLYSNGVLCNGEVEVCYIVGGVEKTQVDGIESVVFYFNTIEFTTNNIEGLTIRLYYKHNHNVFVDINIS